MHSVMMVSWKSLSTYQKSLFAKNADQTSIELYKTGTHLVDLGVEIGSVYGREIVSVAVTTFLPSFLNLDQTDNMG